MNFKTHRISNDNQKVKKVNKTRFKRRFVWRKKKHTKLVKSHLFLHNALWSTCLDNFPGTFVDFCSMFLFKELAHMSIYIHKIINCKVSFKMLVSTCLVIVEKELWTWLWTWQWQKLFSYKYSSYHWF